MSKPAAGTIGVETGQALWYVVSGSNSRKRWALSETATKFCEILEE
ncbi:hypothetical protein [Synoicihabitans lomoniglobus]|uniref:Uncharacterized protein n=1 Tax=Synoicihabitans lomoniglobus TaxID=2909285 RepID=A0AAF0I3T2_9BACT|nr:hypothetical protein [Opitutaceae bacterium LMO-M01]WED67242.1 hypothetical protein PXH66_10295 [Opitutaceae bacterium LMO-M01]